MVRYSYVLGAVCLWCLLVPSGFGQTVQLPGIHRFSVNTSVLAPDRGGARLGGVNRSSRGLSRYGVPGAGKLPGLGRLLGNRAVGGSTSGGGTSVRVTVIDHEELDRAVLAEAERRRAGGATLTSGASELSKRLSSNARSASLSAGGLMSVTEIRRQNAQRKELKQQEALQFAVKGKQAEEKGNVGVAKIYYQMAHRRADDELQKQIARRLLQLQ